MTIEELRRKELIILECISGSRAYGLATEHSDTDIKGVFILPKEMYYTNQYIPQVSNETNDIVFYELGRFVELLSLNNPNILELLYTPSSKVLYKHPYLSDLKPSIFLSKLCEKTFGNYALSQIKKAKGLKKKIVNPMSKERKNLLSFCYVNEEKDSIPVLDFLNKKGWKQEEIGLVQIPHMKGIYGLYHAEKGIYNGIIQNEQSTEVALSSVSKEAIQEGLLYCNKEGFSTYCKKYKEYWNWVEKRNKSRYESTLSNGKNYDAKNMMHVFRLLDMAIEIGKNKKVMVERPNRGFLLGVKSGKYEYDDLIELANDKQKQLKEAFKNSTLQSTPNSDKINRVLYEIRNRFYTK
ncbi:nucleotidyltransferase domain-containing protein [Flammeovirga sp. EKP202]|uniref:DNA polymerase beta superfamily protein n=1 Tax=Flammeovirga sp. EKP202 TaxID=2770592 RepID=UPI00165F35E7|nr:nucleotidyltransferase domain-containing protein [Flammeovirga sp. EKP202]MBD0401698.1 nucleotidyltransferase domain-containing protein [Flammeovirga sp. EKP202]